MGRDLTPHVRRVQLRIRIGAVAISRSARAEHHRAALDGALVHFPQVNGGEVYLESALVAESFQTNVTLHALLAGRGIDELDTESERPRSRRAIASVDREARIRRAAVVGPFVVATAEARSELSEVEMWRRLRSTRHHEIVQAGRQTGHAAAVIFARHVTHSKSDHNRGGHSRTKRCIVVVRTKRAAHDAVAVRLRTRDTGDRDTGEVDGGGGWRGCRRRGGGWEEPPLGGADR